MINSTRMQLPAYLGCATLNEDSIFDQSGRTYAQYKADGEIVYEVEIDKESSTITEHLDSKPISKSSGPDLEAAFFKLACPHIYRSERLRRIVESITSNDIHFIYPRSSKLHHHFFFPGACIFRFRIPILAETRASWNQFKDELLGEGECGKLKLDRERDGLFVVIRRNGKVDVEEVMIGEIITLLKDLKEGANRIRAAGLVSSTSEYKIDLEAADLTEQVLCFSTAPGTSGKFTAALLSRDFYNRNPKEVLNCVADVVRVAFKNNLIQVN